MTLAKTERGAEAEAFKDVAYDCDIYAWAIRQTAFFRAGDWSRLNVVHLANEIVGRTEARELRSPLAVLLLHLSKWDAQPGRRSRSWMLSVRERRVQARDALDENPGLRYRLPRLARNQGAAGSAPARGELASALH